MWYRAQILKYLDSCRRFKILYDDKTNEKIDLTQQNFVTEDRNYKEMALQRKREIKAAGFGRGGQASAGEGQREEVVAPMAGGRPKRVLGKRRKNQVKQGGKRRKLKESLEEEKEAGRQYKRKTS